MHRFYVPSEQVSSDRIHILGSDAAQIMTVLRMKPGENIEIFDSLGNIYLSRIKETGKEKVSCIVIEKKREDIESKIDATLAQCLPKGKKMDLIIQKATELGVNSIIPVMSERSVPKIEEKAERKIDHWQKIAKEAAEQSGRSIIPRISPLSRFDDIIKSAKSYELALIPWESEQKNSLKTILKGIQANLLTGKLLILIGPEGGFSVPEVNKAVRSGFKSITLGKRILRTETAAIALLAQVFYELE